MYIKVCHLEINLHIITTHTLKWKNSVIRSWLRFVAL